MCLPGGEDVGFVLPNLRKYKNFKVSKVAVKVSFLWFTAAFVIGILKNIARLTKIISQIIIISPKR